MGLERILCANQWIAAASSSAHPSGQEASLKQALAGEVKRVSQCDDMGCRPRRRHRPVARMGEAQGLATKGAQVHVYHARTVDGREGARDHVAHITSKAGS